MEMQLFSEFSTARHTQTEIEGFGTKHVVCVCVCVCVCVMGRQRKENTACFPVVVGKTAVDRNLNEQQKNVLPSVLGKASTCHADLGHQLAAAHREGASAPARLFPGSPLCCRG